MREIKFRAWDKEELEMRDWKTISKNLTMEGFYDVIMNLKKFDLMQFTGLEDKNGKEIYEGDIVKFKTLDVTDESNKPTLEWIEKVEFKKGSFMVKDFYLDRDNEIMGNIYEDAGLLEKRNSRSK